MSPDVSVIICAYTLDRWEQLARALRSATEQVPAPREVILVVDHNPGLFARARAEFPDLVVLENAQAPGLSGGRNTGLAAAAGEIVAFLDDDAEAEPGWLEALTSPYSDERVVATGGRVLPVWHTGRPAWMPEEFDWVVGCSYLGLPTREAAVRNPIGCSMSMRRRPALDAGSFRTEVGRIGTLPAGCEETDMAIRLGHLVAGSRVAYVPGSTVHHHVPANRATVRYFLSRCYQEGRSKAIVARLEGERDALSSERSYTLRVLPAGVVQGLAATLRGDPGGIQRAAAILAGLYATTLGYLVGRASERRGHPTGAAPTTTGGAWA